MAKRKLEKATSNGAKPVPCGDEPDPYQIGLAKERFENNCQRNFQQLQSWIAEDDKRDRLYELADKGFQEARDRRRGRRWPILSGKKKVDIAKDLSQAVCVLFAFYDHYQGRQDLINPELRVEYEDVIGELREDVAYSFGPQDEVDIFMRCMYHVKKHIDKSKALPSKPKDKKSKNNSKHMQTKSKKVVGKSEDPEIIQKVKITKNEEPREIPYIEIRLDQRKLVIGDRYIRISPDKVWEFLKELCDSRRYDFPSPTTREQKNARDMLQRIIKNQAPQQYKATWSNLISTSRGKYELGDSVKVAGGAQAGIRRSR